MAQSSAQDSYSTAPIRFPPLAQGNLYLTCKPFVATRTHCTHPHTMGEGGLLFLHHLFLHYTRTHSFFALAAWQAYTESAQLRTTMAHLELFSWK